MVLPHYQGWGSAAWRRGRLGVWFCRVPARRCSMSTAPRASVRALWAHNRGRCVLFRRPFASVRAFPVASRVGACFMGPEPRSVRAFAVVPIVGARFSPPEWPSVRDEPRTDPAFGRQDHAPTTSPAREPRTDEGIARQTSDFTHPERLSVHKRMFCRREVDPVAAGSTFAWRKSAHGDRRVHFPFPQGPCRVHKSPVCAHGGEGFGAVCAHGVRRVHFSGRQKCP